MIHYDMPENEYRKLDAYGSTDLKNVLRSYHHMLSFRQTFHETPALKFGRAFHCAVLEPERFAKDYVVMPTFSGKGMRERKEHWILEHADHQWLGPEEMLAIQAMDRALVKHHAAYNLLLDIVHPELSLSWDEPTPAGAMPMKARLDGVTPWTVLDIKTTLDASPEAFGRQVANYNYLLQAEHYLAGARACAIPQLRVERFTFIAVEKEPPFGVGVYEISTDQLEVGANLRSLAIARIGNYMKQPKSTPYSPNTEPLQLPAWAWKGIE